MKPMSLAHTGFELATKRTGKREFVDEMNLVVPWSELLALIAPHALAGKTGWPPFATKAMLRIHLLQPFLVHSDPAMEEALHDIPLHQAFALLHGSSAHCPTSARSCVFVTCPKSMGCRHRYACNTCTGPKTGSKALKEQEIGTKFSTGFAMCTFTHQLAL